MATFLHFIQSTTFTWYKTIKFMVQIIKIVLAIIFGLAALAKLTGKTKEIFKKSGYGLSFMYATAVAEVIFSVGLFTQFELTSVVGLLSIVVGAIVTLISQNAHPTKFIMAVLSLILLFVLRIIE